MYTNHNKINIFEYTHYRKFLRDFYESGKSVSFRSFAKAAGFQSPSFLKMVIEGQRNLSHESIRKVADALRFNAEETQFFTQLVLLNQAQGLDERRFYAEQLFRVKGFKRINPLKAAQYEYLTSWYYIAVRELVGTESFVEDPQWIAEALEPRISAAEARQAIETLLELKLIRRDEDGKLVQTDEVVSTGDETDLVSAAHYHREMIKKGAEAIERFEPSERDVSSLTFGAGPQTVRQIKELVQRFRKEMIAILVNSPEKSTEVYQLNFQYFPLSRNGKIKRKGTK